MNSYKNNEPIIVVNAILNESPLNDAHQMLKYQSLDPFDWLSLRLSLSVTLDLFILFYDPL